MTIRAVQKPKGLLTCTAAEEDSTRRPRAIPIPPQFTVDFASRSLPSELTVTNAVPNPQLTFDEGRAVVSSMWPEIGVSARVYYTAGERDERLHAITDSKVVVYDAANHGD